MTSKDLTKHSDKIDAELISACRDGTRDAQRQLYESCHRQVYGLMVRMVGEQEAADATQQVFLQLFRKIDQFAGGSRFTTWMYRLATNEALQYLRKHRRWRHQPLVQEPTSNGPTMTQRHEQKEVLEQALARLEPELRAIFVLREVEGLSYREIAEATDIPEGTVGSRMNRARRQLQQHLSDLGWEA